MFRVLLSTIALVLGLPWITPTLGDWMTNPVIVETDAGVFQVYVTLDDAGYADLEGVGYKADLILGDQSMPVAGEFNRGALEKGLLSGDATGAVEGPIELHQAAMILTVEESDIEFSIGDNHLTNAILDNLQVLIRIDINKKSLSLHGQVNGKYHDGMIDLKGSLGLLADFEYSKEPVSFILRAKQPLAVKVKNSEFRFAGFESIQVTVAIPLADHVLSLGGTVTGQIDDGFAIEFNGQLEVSEPFTYKTGPLALSFSHEDKLNVKVANGELKAAQFNGVNLVLTLSDDLHDLRAEGDVAEGSYKGGTLHFEASLNVSQPFRYEKGPVKLSFTSGDAIFVSVIQGEFKYAEFIGSAVSVEIPSESQPLQLEGTIPGRLYEGFQVDFTGELSVRDDFTYRKGDVTVSLSAGDSLEVKVVQSEFGFAKFKDALVRVGVPTEGKDLTLQATVDSGEINAAYDIDFHASMEITEDFTYQKGRAQTTLAASNSLDVVVRNSAFKNADLAGAWIEVSLAMPGGDTANLSGQILKGKLKPNKLRYLANVQVLEEFSYLDGAERINISPQKGELRLNQEVVKFDGDENDFKVPLDDEEQDPDSTGASSLGSSCRLGIPCAVDGL